MRNLGLRMANFIIKTFWNFDYTAFNFFKNFVKSIKALLLLLHFSRVAIDARE